MRVRIAAAMLGLHLALLPGQDWPMGSGPAGNWTSTGASPPQRFSATTGENIAWRTPLPETGQGSIAVVRIGVRTKEQR